MNSPTYLMIGLLLTTAASSLAAPSGIVQVWSGIESFDDALIANEMAAELRLPGRAGGAHRDAIFLHPVGEGDAVATFQVRLPEVDAGDRLILSFWLGLSDGVKFEDEENPLDGVGLAVRIGERELLRTSLMECVWVPNTLDLAPWAGQEVELTLATDSGGAGNASYDWAMFGEPRIMLFRGNASGADGVIEGTAGVLLIEYEDARQDACARLTPEEGDGPGLMIPLSGTGIAFREFGPTALGSAHQFRVTTEGVTVKELRVCLHQPELIIENLGSESAVGFAHQPIAVAATIGNVGKAALLASHLPQIRLTPGTSQSLGRIDPGATTRVVWELPGSARTERQVSATLRWQCDNEDKQATARASVTVLAAMPRLPAAAPERSESRRLHNGVHVLQNPHVRFAFLPQVCSDEAGARRMSYCCGPVLCYARVDGEWRRVAAMPPVWDFAQLQHAAAPTRGLAVHAGRTDGAAWLRIGREPQADIAQRVLQSVTFTLPDDGRATEIVTTLQSGVRAELTKLCGPKVLVGDGSTGRRKRMALFPGLEYLEGDEASSSTLDAAPPINNRLAPDPYKVTIPLMAVETDDALVALLWDQTQKWDGESITVSAAFASPNFVDGQANHMMQLFLPSGSDYVDENELTPHTPYPMKPGATITMRQHLLIDTGGEVLDAVDHWAAVYGGVPEPQPEPRSFEEELALSRYGFMNTVWDDASGKSRHCVGWSSDNAPAFATLLLFDSRITGDAAAAARANLIAHRTIEQQGDRGLLSGACCHILGGELPFHWGRLPQVYRAMRQHAHGAMGQQGEDGGWSFRPDERRRALGEPGTATLGLCARPAWTLLRHARWTGDALSLSAGLRALEFIDANFTVPRGAQGWECPIHEPDILASAYAVGAYVEAFRATRDQRWLTGARYWARTGLPFLYLWDDPEKPGMRYASIPVFGTTFFTHSWFGVPVQWCGLVYAYHLQHLAKYDDSFPWDRVAAGITVSGMYQQFGDEMPELKGCYPDGWYNTFSRRAGPIINPEDIIINRLVMAGYDPAPETAILRINDEEFHMTTGATIEEARVVGSAATYRLSYFAGEASHGFIADVAAPDSVTLDGAPMKAARDLQNVDSGYVYDREQAALFFKITHGTEPVSLVVSGLERSLPDAPKPRASWSFDDGVQGWHAGNQCHLVATKNETLRVQVTGDDAYFISGPAAFDATRHPRVLVRARSSAGSALGLFWRTTLHPAWGEDKHTTTAFACDGEWREAAFDLSDHPLWEGSVTALRLDLEPPDAPEGTTLEIDWVRAD